MIEGTLQELSEKYKVSQDTLRDFLKRLGITKTFPNPLTTRIYYYYVDEHNDKFIKDYLKSDCYKLRSRCARKAHKTIAKNRIKQKAK